MLTTHCPNIAHLVLFGPVKLLSELPQVGIFFVAGGMAEASRRAPGATARETLELPLQAVNLSRQVGLLFLPGPAMR